MPQATLAFALAGDVAQAQKLSDELARRFPADTLINAIWIASARAAVEIHGGNATKAIELLRAAAPYEAGNFTPVYLRGQAFLRARSGSEAAASSRKSSITGELVLNRRSTRWRSSAPGAPGHLPGMLPKPASSIRIFWRCGRMAIRTSRSCGKRSRSTPK